jgi:hypothetical protein
LLPELSRQTYDSFYKALREAVLNAIDADASVVDIDFTDVATTSEMSVIDDGVGMTTREFCDHFMSLGGSSRFGHASRFGRIGIGSLALLQYGVSATVETKRAGSNTYTVARIEHPWTMARDERRSELSDLPAGVAEEHAYSGPPDDHFTRLRLHGVSNEVLSVGRDPADFYRLLENLRRILPLQWGDAALAQELALVAPDLAGTLNAHCRDWSCRVRVHSGFQAGVDLTRRFFGDDQGQAEEWTGPVVPLHKTLSVNDGQGRRKVTVAGFLLNQSRAIASWSGVTARVQNVAVEERTFFDVTADPGFRKYITGEVWILGDVDRERLINIDRSSFNRECADYIVVQRFMSRVLTEFKARHVQRPQRQKVTIRRALEDHRALLAAVAGVLNRASELASDQQVPSSESARRQRGAKIGLSDVLQQLGADVLVRDISSAHGYDLTISGDGERVVAIVDPELAAPRVLVRDKEFRIIFVHGNAADPPVVVRRRPREIRFRVCEPGSGVELRQAPLSLALELAYLLADDGTAESVYEASNSLIEVI